MAYLVLFIDIDFALMTLASTVTGGLDSSIADPVSSIGYGGGSSGQGIGAAPTALINVTPPAPSPGEADTTQVIFVNCQSGKRPYTFSPKTCLELLKRDCLTNDQLDFERHHLKTLGHDIYTQSRIKTSKPVVLKALEEQLILQTCYDYDLDIRKYSNIVSHFSYLVKQAEAEMETLRSTLTPPVTLPSSLDVEGLLQKTEQILADCSSTTEVKPDVDNSVCRVFEFDAADFSDITVGDILGQINIDRPVANGNRSTAYFGDIPYSYGHVRHEPCPYPTCDVFSKVFDRMKSVDQDFTPDKYTCLLTLYPNGKAHIPPHTHIATTKFR